MLQDADFHGLPKTLDNYKEAMANPTPEAIDKLVKRLLVHLRRDQESVSRYTTLFYKEQCFSTLLRQQLTDRLYNEWKEQQEGCMY